MKDHVRQEQYLITVITVTQKQRVITVTQKQRDSHFLQTITRIILS